MGAILLDLHMGAILERFGSLVLTCFCVLSQSTSRIFLLTNNNLLLADQKSGQIKSEVPLVDVTKVSMSSQNDGFFAVHL